MHPELTETLTTAARSNADVNDLLAAHLTTPEMLDQTSAAVLKTVVSAPDRGQLPHVNLAQFLIYLLVHDAHHRGQILLALKAGGLPLPDEAALWSPWNS